MQCSKSNLFDHLVGADEQCRRHGDPERFSRLEIDNCVKFVRPLDRKFARVRTLQNLVNESGGQTRFQSCGGNATRRIQIVTKAQYNDSGTIGRRGSVPLLRSLPEQPVMRDLYKSQPASCKPLGELTEVAMRGPSPFTQGQRELIAAYVSGLNACNYCHATHSGVAAAFGVEPELFNALLTDIDLAPVEDRMKPILRYARKLTLSPARMSEADAAALYEAGWGDDALYSTVLVVALFNFYNRLVDGVGLALPEGYVAEAAKRLSTQGYNVFAQIAKA